MCPWEIGCVCELATTRTVHPIWDLPAGQTLDSGRAVSPCAQPALMGRCRPRGAMQDGLRREGERKGSADAFGPADTRWHDPALLVSSDQAK
jgi:hypothetical protein